MMGNVASSRLCQMVRMRFVFVLVFFLLSTSACVWGPVRRSAFFNSCGCATGLDAFEETVDVSGYHPTLRVRDICVMGEGSGGTVRLCLCVLCSPLF